MLVGPLIISIGYDKMLAIYCMFCVRDYDANGFRYKFFFVLTELLGNLHGVFLHILAVIC